MATKPNLVCVGIKGSVVAFDQESGTRIWETDLKGGAFVTLLVDGDRIFAATQGEIFCLRAADGEVLWHDPLKGYGLGFVSIATKNGSSNPSTTAAEQAQQDQSASGAAVVAG
jgi:outer membrane protein assembly factor BamB